MKNFFTLSFLMIGFVAFAQKAAETKPVPDKKQPVSSPVPNSQNQTTEPRKPSGAVKPQTSAAAPLPYDVDDKYMGRREEFLLNLTVSELPSDFPVYEKQWGLKEYNQVVLAFYYNHLGIVKEGVRKKLETLEH